MPGEQPAAVALSSWVPGADGSLFPVENLPYGVFSEPTDGAATRRIGVAIGDSVLDLGAAASLLGPPFDSLLAAHTLNPFMAAGPATWRSLRERLTEGFTDERHRGRLEAHLCASSEVQLHLAFEVADYVDFYSSEHHATNVGRLFRPDQEPLTPNWRHQPIGYHGRAGTVALSGTPVQRPSGQRKAPADPAPTFGASQRLDIEAEVGFVIGVGSELGHPIPIDDFRQHVFGVCLVNDWSARDLQAWEYVPLGPFLGKSFLTSVSPWIVPLDALASARVRPPVRPVELLDYLRDDAEAGGFDLSLEVRLNGELVSSPPFGLMYWTAAQQLAHLSVNGASTRTGDLYASGTVSGPEPHQRGSFLELAWGGAAPLHLADGQTRVFLEDGDEVVITATAPGLGGTTIGFGEVRGRVLPARVPS